MTDYTVQGSGRMDPRDELTIWVGACRYYLGRQSYAVSMFCEALRAAWPSLSAETQDIIMRDIDEAFERDDRARADRSSGAERTYLPLGHNCDRESWEGVRRLWKP